MEILTMSKEGGPKIMKSEIRSLIYKYIFFSKFLRERCFRFLQIQRSILNLQSYNIDVYWQLLYLKQEFYTIG